MDSNGYSLSDVVAALGGNGNGAGNGTTYVKQVGGDYV